jgi:hypothetical protein
MNIHTGPIKNVYRVTYQTDLREVLGSLLFEADDPLTETVSVYVHLASEVSSNLIPSYDKIKSFVLLGVEPEIADTKTTCWTCLVESFAKTTRVIIHARNEDEDDDGF